MFSRDRISKKTFLSKRKIFFFTFQSHEMKSIDNIFAFSIICFNVYIKSISMLLVLVLVVLVLVFRDLFLHDLDLVNVLENDRDLY